MLAALASYWAAMMPTYVSSVCSSAAEVKARSMIVPDPVTTKTHAMDKKAARCIIDRATNFILDNKRTSLVVAPILASFS